MQASELDVFAHRALLRRNQNICDTLSIAWNDDRQWVVDHRHALSDRASGSTHHCLIHPDQMPFGAVPTLPVIGVVGTGPKPTIVDVRRKLRGRLCRNGWSTQPFFSGFFHRRLTIWQVAYPDHKQPDRSLIPFVPVNRWRHASTSG